MHNAEFSIPTLCGSCCHRVLSHRISNCSRETKNFFLQICNCLPHGQLHSPLVAGVWGGGVPLARQATIRRIPCRESNQVKPEDGSEGNSEAAGAHMPLSQTNVVHTRHQAGSNRTHSDRQMCVCVCVYTRQKSVNTWMVACLHKKIGFFLCRKCLAWLCLMQPLCVGGLKCTPIVSLL